MDQLIEHLRSTVIQSITNEPSVKEAIEKVVEQMETRRQKDLKSGVIVPGSNGNRVSTGQHTSRYGIQYDWDAVTGPSAGLEQEERELKNFTRLFRRGGPASRLQHGLMSFAQEQNLSGLGRAADALVGGPNGMVNSFYLLIMTRWVDEMKRYVDAMTREMVDRAIAQIGAKIDVRRIAADVKALLKNDPDFRKATARGLFQETREEEKSDPRPGFWARRGPFSGIR